MRRITAKLRTKCTCGTWVQPGWKILWDPEYKMTVGCPFCKPNKTQEVPDPEASDAPFDPYWDFPTFHENS